MQVKTFPTLLHTFVAVAIHVIVFNSSMFLAMVRPTKLTMPPICGVIMFQLAPVAF